MTQAALVPLLVFMALLLVLSLLGLAAAGHFPQEHRRLPGRWGSLVLFGSIGLSLISLATGLVAAWRLIPWYAAIIGGGAMVLFAPLLLRPFPDRFVDSPAALVVFAGAGLLLASLLIWMT